MCRATASYFGTAAQDDGWPRQEATVFECREFETCQALELAQGRPCRQSSESVHCQPCVYPEQGPEAHCKRQYASGAPAHAGRAHGRGAGRPDAGREPSRSVKMVADTLELPSVGAVDTGRSIAICMSIHGRTTLYNSHAFGRTLRRQSRCPPPSAAARGC